MLILKAMRRMVARAIPEGADDMLLIEHGALYPALQRLEVRGAIVGESGTSQNNRRARFFRLTKRGRKELASDRTRWHRLAAIGRILGPEPA